MMTDDEADPTLCALSRLRVLDPNERRAGRTRARCHTLLAKHRSRMSRPPNRDQAAPAIFAPLVMGGFCIVYFAAIVLNAVRMMSLR
jgi:hypothetical protein